MIKQRPKILLHLGSIRIVAIKVIFIMLIFTSSCQSEISEERNFPQKFACEYSFNDLNLKDGEGLCYYDNGGLREITMWRNDTIINEKIIYSEEGQVLEYLFYNVLGVVQYSRLLREDGKLIEEKGSPLIQEIISFNEIKVGDSINIDIYVATPPGCEFKIWGVDSDGRYEVFEDTDKLYKKKLAKRAKKSGNFVFPYEIEFIDSVNETSKVLKGDINLRVKD